MKKLIIVLRYLLVDSYCMSKEFRWRGQYKNVCILFNIINSAGLLITSLIALLLGLKLNQFYIII